MTNRHTVAALIVLVIGLVAPSSARAQVIPSPPWGEPIQDPSRFVVLASYNNQAVYDNETGLVWEQSPEPTQRRDWFQALAFCAQRTVGNRKGWRLPSVQELASLVDPTVPSPGPTLPADHPFGSNVQSDYYWSASTQANSATGAWLVFFYGGNVGTASVSFTSLVWCVRGGPGPR